MSVVVSDQIKNVAARAKEKFGDAVTSVIEAHGELTIEVDPKSLFAICEYLRDDGDSHFEMLIDLCGVDYLDYRKEAAGPSYQGPRFAVVYHLLSIRHNMRIRVRTFIEGDVPIVDSVVNVWNSANWYEREAFDLFGIVFDGHPDLRRLLTDYGFVGHPFRKDFPISGNVEMRYDERKRRVVYEPVSIEPRSLTKRVIREEGFGG
jgi:NADH-quinone oxidoreductase subunit C